MTSKRWLALGLAALVPLLLMAATRKNQTLPYGEVNWDRGYVRISAVGLPPFGSDPSVKDPESARANAVSTAQKRLLGVLLDLDVKGGTLRERVAGHPDLKERLRQMVFAAGVTGRNYADGSVEVTLTMPVKGPNGLQGFLDGL
jgi:hypothetical protein